MIVEAISTHKITSKDVAILDIIDRYIETLPEGSVLCVTSKIIAICEGRAVKDEGRTKHELIAEEADWYIPADRNKYGTTVSIKGSVLVGSAGIDASNGDGHFVLWPQDPQRSANEIRAFLIKKCGVKRVGVVITDSHSIPMQNGSIGCAIAHSGFVALDKYIGKKDLFDREIHVSKRNVANALAAAAVLVMGEGAEQTPIAMIRDVPFVRFVEKDPTDEERAELYMSMEDDMFHDLLLSAPWVRGGKK